MSDKYNIRVYMDDEYGVYSIESGELVFKGSLQTVNAWIQLQKEGFDL
jgi:hypothetical protein